MSYSEFHAAQPTAQRPASDVFKSSTSEQEHAIKSRFASGGKFTSEQLDAGDDLKAQEAAAAASSSSGLDPNDNRSLYERLQANKDAKQEEFDHNNSFKNQMDHWKLDEDEAAFEEERQLKLRQQQQEAKRLHDEGAEFYRLARAAREQSLQQPPASAAGPAKAAAAASAVGAEKRKQKQQLVKPAFKVLKVEPKSSSSSGGDGSGGGGSGPSVPGGTAAAATAAPAPQSEKAAKPAALPGMGEYEDSDEDDD